MRANKCREIELLPCRAPRAAYAAEAGMNIVSATACRKTIQSSLTIFLVALGVPTAHVSRVLCRRGQAHGSVVVFSKTEVSTIKKQFAQSRWANPQHVTRTFSRHNSHVCTIGRWRQTSRFIRSPSFRPRWRALLTFEQSKNSLPSLSHMKS